MHEKTLQVILSGDRTLQLNPAQIEQLNVILLPDGNYHILQDGRRMEAEIIEADIQAKRFRIRIGAKVHSIRLQDQYDAIVNTMGLAVGQRKVTDIKAPMPGLVRDILVRAGDEFVPGQTLLVLEAMKMENALKAPAAGIVKAVRIEPGQAVDKGMVLLELE